MTMEHIIACASFPGPWLCFFCVCVSLLERENNASGVGGHRDPWHGLYHLRYQPLMREFCFLGPKGNTYLESEAGD